MMTKEEAHTRFYNLVRLTEDLLGSGYREDPGVAAAVFSEGRPILPAEKVEPQSIAKKSDFRQEVRSCRKCASGESRKTAVVGSGNPRAGLMVIYDQPGAEDEVVGLPLSGKTGEFFGKWMESIGVDRKTGFFLVPLVKCRPPNGRRADAAEIAACRELLQWQIDEQKPSIILALGQTAARELSGSSDSLEALRQRDLSYGNAKLVATYHPDDALADPALKRPVWEDLKLLKSKLDEIR